MAAITAAVLMFVFCSVVFGMMGVLNSKGRLDGLYRLWYKNGPADGDRTAAYMTRFFLVFAVAFAVAALLILVLNSLWAGVIILLVADFGLYILRAGACLNGCGNGIWAFGRPEAGARCPCAALPLCDNTIQVGGASCEKRLFC